MSPELVVFAIAIAVIVLVWVAGMLGIWKLFEISKKESQAGSDVALVVSLFVFQVIMLLLLVFVLWLGLLIASMRS